MPKFELFDKEAALENALNLFWEKGYNGTSIRDLEIAMKLGKSSIYNSFGDKETLFFAALKHYMNTEQARIISSITSAGNAIQAIREILNCVIHPVEFQETSLTGCLFVNSLTELTSTHPGMRQFALDAKATTLQLLKAIITKAKQEGDVPLSKKTTELALYLFSAMQGLKVTGMLAKTPNELLPVIDLIMETIINT